MKVHRHKLKYARVFPTQRWNAGLCSSAAKVTAAMGLHAMWLTAFANL
jgi:hypothetical protein